MIGGYYVAVVQPTTKPKGGEMVALIAGPFATWTEADKIGSACAKQVTEANPALTNLEWGICEFWFHRLVLGVRNSELWVKATPVER